MADTWPATVSKAQTIAEMLDWVRRRAAGKALVGVMIGTNSVTVCRDPKLSPRDAIRIVRDELAAIERALLETEQKKVTRTAVPRTE